MAQRRVSVAAGCLQGHEANQALLGKGNGVDTLLVCLAGFKSKEPVDDLEQETMENLFDTLCSCLLLPANRQVSGGMHELLLADCCCYCWRFHG
jgi:hypothetical protein